MAISPKAFDLLDLLCGAIAGKRAFERRSDAQTLSAIIEAEPEPLTTAAPNMTTFSELWQLSGLGTR